MFRFVASFGQVFCLIYELNAWKASVGAEGTPLFLMSSNPVVYGM
jgi:hypothetical protein